MNELMGKVIKELEHVFDVLKSAIDINRKRIIELERRIQELENK
jgi:polyhydroxyalkanoate synthesis regulator phasin